MPYRHGLTQQPATKHQTAAHSPLPFPLSEKWSRNGQKVKLLGCDKYSLIRQQKIIIIVIKKNMQSKQ